MAPGREWPSMILKEAQQIAHGLIQGFISPDQSDGHALAFAARYYRRFRRHTSAVKPKS